MTDYRMRGMSGAELARRIRSVSNVLVIVYSMFDDQWIPEESLAAGANRFILNDPRRGSHRLLFDGIRRPVHDQ